MAQPTTALYSTPAVVVTSASVTYSYLVRHDGLRVRAHKVGTLLQQPSTRLAGHCQRLSRPWLPTQCNVAASELRVSTQPQVATSKVIQSGPFVCREGEKQWLAQLLEKRPPQITILLGPSGSGKTSLLQHYVETCGEGRAQPTYIPCRRLQAKRDVGLLQGTSTMNELLAPYKKHVAGTLADNTAAKPSPNAKCRPNNPLGPIVIDDADMLKEGVFDYSFQSGPALRLLRLISKDQGVAHVIMAASDPTFISWMKEEIGASSFTVCALGDLTEEHARAFFDMCHGACVDDAGWDEIYQVCGGNLGLLRQAATTAHGSDWESVLAPMWMPILTEMREALTGYRWTRKSITLVMKELVNARHHAVSFNTLDSKLEIDKMKDLLKLGLFTIRPYTELASDIPREAYGKFRDPVVVAATPAHLYCMGKLVKKKGSKRLVQHVGQAQDGKGLLQLLVPGGPWLFFPALLVSGLATIYMARTHVLLVFQKRQV